MGLQSRAQRSISPKLEEIEYCSVPVIVVYIPYYYGELGSINPNDGNNNSL